MTKSSTFDASALPDLTGRVVLITGGHSGLGLATTTALASKNAKVYIATRSITKAEAAIQEIKNNNPNAQVEIVELDLGDLRSVKKGAEDFLQRETSLHILINNAGIMCPPFSLTPQGHETQLQTNHLAHHLLTTLLLPLLFKTASTSPPRTVRVLNVSSDAHRKLAPKTGISFSDMNLTDKSPWTRYGHSKLCNVLHSLSLAEKYGNQNLLSLSLHPGTVKTNLSHGPRTSTPLYALIQPLIEWGAPGPTEGCANILWCATSDSVRDDDNGMYFEPVGKRGGVGRHGRDAVMAGRLWEWSQGVLERGGFL
ncbi:NAD(P)-binding protein [Mollisia scopiformis]|uniref:NAD(P)-binding protein n=1 Tax=Mollisia scopiformis TaxID=149040 RepID=A0A132B1W8_MOLSC|nr:NAD(P)-binding protein [Mollisia scopiformis]KUJ06376.1 NAD(P)-binding protein [Mollisia scopiformis]